MKRYKITVEFKSHLPVLTIQGALNDFLYDVVGKDTTEKCKIEELDD